MEKIDDFTVEKINDPRPYILGIINQINPLGANDSEIPALYNLIDKFQKKKITAEEALQKAREIEKQKLDGAYH